jgi:hypothetical protein
VVVSTREGVRFRRGFPRAIEDLHVEPRKEFSPSEMTRLDLPSRGEVLEVLVVRDDDGGGSAEVGKVLLPLVKGLDDGKELLIVDVVVNFRRLHRLGHVGQRFPDFSLKLRENCSIRVLRSVGFDHLGFVVIREGEYWGCGDDPLEFLERFLLGWSPFPLDVLFREIVQGESNLRKVLDETSVEVEETDEGAKLFEGLRNWPVKDALDLYRIHRDLSLGNDKAEELDFGDLELALLRFDEQLMLSENLEDFPCHSPEDLKVGVEDENIVNVNQHATRVNAFPENLVHHGLEGGWAVAHSEEHDNGLKEAEVTPESTFPLITFSDSDVVESTTNVHFGEVLGVTEPVNDFRNQGRG